MLLVDEWCLFVIFHCNMKGWEKRCNLVIGQLVSIVEIRRLYLWVLFVCSCECVKLIEIGKWCDAIFDLTCFDFMLFYAILCNFMQFNYTTVPILLVVGVFWQFEWLNECTVLLNFVNGIVYVNMFVFISDWERWFVSFYLS